MLLLVSVSGRWPLLPRALTLVLLLAQRHARNSGAPLRG
jgi:hypothetical protein